MEQHNQQFRDDDFPGIWKHTSELMEEDKKHGTCYAVSFLAGFPADCRTNLQWYVLGEHGERAADELYELLKPDTPDEVTDFVDTHCGLDSRFGQ